MNKDDCEQIVWARLNIENLRLTKKVLLSLIDDSYDTLRNCPEA